MVTTVDTVELEAKVKEMYRHVAQEPGGDYHFELGERLALRVGLRRRSAAERAGRGRRVLRRRRLLLRPRRPDQR